MVAVSIIKEGIDVVKLLSIMEISHTQLDEINLKNFNARITGQQPPFSKEYKEKALDTYIKSKVLLDKFLEYLNTTDEIEAKIEKLKEKHKKFGDYSSFFIERAKSLESFLESIRQQIHLVPLVELALEEVDK